MHRHGRSFRTPLLGALLASLALGASGPAATARAEDPVVTYFGSAGSFGGLESARSPAGGRAFGTHAVPGWGFLPGQAAYFTALAPDGTVLIANEPQTDNQFQPTSRQMAVSTFHPGTDAFENVVIATTTGKEQALAGGQGVVGGADIADIDVLTTPDGPRAVFLSAVPYHDWDLAQDGEYPTLGALAAGAPGRWRHDAQRSRTAIHLATDQGSPCRAGRNSRWQALADCRAPTELAALPRSGDLAITQYAAGAGTTGTSGSLVVLGPTGEHRASYPYPDITLPGGQRLGVHPREIDANPTSPYGAERFTVIFDVVEGEGRAEQRLASFAAQEFSYDAAARVLRPTSLPVLSGQQVGGRQLGFETGQYDARGRLWLAQAVQGTLQGGPLALYEPEADGGTLSRPGCAAAPGWSGAGWGATCAPSQSVAEAIPLGVVRSLTADPESRGVLAATMSGQLLPVVLTDGAARARPALDLGLDRLVDRVTTWVGPRKGAVDAHTGDVWLAIQQLRTPASCPAHPCTPVPLDQWLVRVDAGSLLGAATEPGASPPAAAPGPSEPVAPVGAGPAAAAPSTAGPTRPVTPGVRVAAPAPVPRLRTPASVRVGTLLRGLLVAEVRCSSGCSAKAELRTLGAHGRLLATGAIVVRRTAWGKLSLAVRQDRRASLRGVRQAILRVRVADGARRSVLAATVRLRD